MCQALCWVLRKPLYLNDVLEEQTAHAPHTNACHYMDLCLLYIMNISNTHLCINNVFPDGAQYAQKETKWGEGL